MAIRNTGFEGKDNSTAGEEDIVEGRHPPKVVAVRSLEQNRDAENLANLKEGVRR